LKDKTDFVGVIDIQANFAFVSTANPKKCTDIFYSKDKIGEAEQGCFSSYRRLAS
jgi:ribonuclease R